MGDCRRKKKKKENKILIAGRSSIVIAKLLYISIITPATSHPYMLRTYVCMHWGDEQRDKGVALILLGSALLLLCGFAARYALIYNSITITMSYRKRSHAVRFDAVKVQLLEAEYLCPCLDDRFEVVSLASAIRYGRYICTRNARRVALRCIARQSLLHTS